MSKAQREFYPYYVLVICKDLRKEGSYFIREVTRYYQLIDGEAWFDKQRITEYLQGCKRLVSSTTNEVYYCDTSINDTSVLKRILANYVAGNTQAYELD